ncbi:MAG: aldo/keto reductase [Ignavibacteriales bacterium]|nr:aldo/keto reductase [Ignavibacteriales bacterium]
MEFRFLGKTGLKVSALSFGSWVTFGDQINKKVAADCMKTAYDSGVNFFDNAEAYAGGKSEIMMGNIINDFGWKRSDLVLSTKIYWGGSGPNDRGLSMKHIIEGTNAALKRLKTDYVDLIFCHRPDLYTPIEETVRAMNIIINQGKAFYWGTSEWTATQIMEAYQIARRENLIPPVMEQPQYNMFAREKVEVEFSELYEKIGLGTTIFSPLASGILTGKYKNGIPKDSRMALKGYEWLKERLESEAGKKQIEKTIKLEKIANELDCTLSQLAIAWCLVNPNVSTVITGASKSQQVKSNMKSLDIVSKLTTDVLIEIEQILDNKPNWPFDWRNM